MTSLQMAKARHRLSSPAVHRVSVAHCFACPAAHRGRRRACCRRRSRGGVIAAPLATFRQRQASGGIRFDGRGVARHGAAGAAGAGSRQARALPIRGSAEPCAKKTQRGVQRSRPAPAGTPSVARRRPSDDVDHDAAGIKLNPAAFGEPLPQAPAGSLHACLGARRRQALGIGIRPLRHAFAVARCDGLA
jgi:hypothetical protein